MGHHEPPQDYRDPGFADEAGWRALISPRLRVYWSQLPDEFRAGVAAFALETHNARSDD